MNLTSISVVVVYFAIVLYIGGRTAKFVKTAEDYMVAGRNLGFMAFMILIVGSVMSGMTVLGSSGLSYIAGWPSMWEPIFVCLSVAVYEGTVDNIIGIVCVKDLLAIFDKKSSADLCEFLRPVHYVPETKSARDLLNELKEKHFYMTIVLDEFGGTAGLVTMEDLIEEIVGEIRDEYDYDEEEQVIMKPNGEYIIDGRMTIDDINDFLDLELPEGEFTTIGGLLYTLIGRVPDKGETVLLEEEGYKLVAESVARRKIKKVRLIKLKDSMQLKNTS
jgi:Mg2+/Co2+ transporter CorC